MRFLLTLIMLSLLLAILGFSITNLETLTTVTLWKTTYRDVPLWSVVFLSALAGIVSVGIIAVIDGGLVRLRNRQMARELRRLETELNFLRTQPSAGRREPDLPDHAELAEDVDEPAPVDRDDVLVSAPVYGADDEDEDDPYTGGRAV
jgi:plasmid stabilization system protein ParE